MNTYPPVNVLIIDDDPINNFILEKLTKRVVPDANIAGCLNGRAAIGLLQDAIKNDKRQLPQHIFLDLRMPVMDGWEFLEEYNRLNMDSTVGAKIYIATSSIFSKDKERAFTYTTVQDFISKPITINKLEQILE
nr:response regulator [uncultured Mucilaginibacter sp.]